MSSAGKQTKPRDNKRGNNKGNNRGGKNTKNPFAKDPVQKEADKIKEQTSAIGEQFAKKLAEIHQLQESEYVKTMKESRAYLKKNVYPKIEEITDKENKIKDSIAAQKADRKRFFEEMKETLPLRQKKDELFPAFIQRNLDSVDAEIRDLESQMMSIKSLQEEKQIVSAIDRAKAKRRQIAAFEERKTTESGGDYKEQLDKLKEEKQPYLDDLNKHKAIIKENQKKHDENFQKIKALKADLTKLNEQRDALNAQYKEKKKILDEKWTVWKKEQQEIKKQKDIEYKARKEQEKKEREEEEARRKVEEASRPPMMKELEACENLISYLDNLKYNKKKPSQKLNHALDAFGNFSEFKLTPPQRPRDIPERREALIAKRDEIKQIQAEALKKREEEAAAKKLEEEKQESEAPAKEEEKEEPVPEAAPTTEEVAKVEETAAAEAASEE